LLKEEKMVELKDITQENFWKVISLKVGKDQNFVASNAISIAQSKLFPSMIPLAIYINDNIVGFLMFGIDPDDNNYWIIRLMVDEKYQKNGYGKKAMKIIMKKIIEDKNHNKIVLSTNPENIVGINLYKKLGFKTTGKIQDGEEVFEYTY
jgi:diamine N-acetyltransferase